MEIAVGVSDKVLLSEKFQSRPGSRQKFLLRKFGVGSNRILSLSGAVRSL